MIKLYEVGGSIRDELLGRPNNDRDFVAVCPQGWDALVKWSEDNLDKVFLVSPEFFTLRGKRGNKVIDIVMARKDGAYSDGRRPDTVEPGTLEDDLLRRDFTMNAMAREVNLETFEPVGEIIDPIWGSMDISERVIRIVHPEDSDSCHDYIGETFKRMIEDPLRLIRALRFCVTLELTLSPNLSDILRYNEFHSSETCEVFGRVKPLEEKPSELIKGIARERVREELTKLFKDNPLKACTLFTNNMEESYDFHVHPDISKAIFGDDIWLKPTMEKRK